MRLVGDAQQLAAIGAGGVLRDIKTQHGAVQLTELHRFTNPTEAHATLALRDGDPKALDSDDYRPDDSAFDQVVELGAGFAARTSPSSVKSRCGGPPLPDRDFMRWVQLDIADAAEDRVSPHRRD